MGIRTDSPGPVLLLPVDLITVPLLWPLLGMGSEQTSPLPLPTSPPLFFIRELRTALQPRLPPEECLEPRQSPTPCSHSELRPALPLRRFRTIPSPSPLLCSQQARYRFSSRGLPTWGGGGLRTASRLPSSPLSPQWGGRLFIDPPLLHQSSPTMGSEEPCWVPPSALAPHPTSPPPLPPSCPPPEWRGSSPNPNSSTLGGS